VINDQAPLCVRIGNWVDIRTVMDKILSCVGGGVRMTYKRGVWIGWLDLLTPY
jgi:hypothetical protein